MASRVGVFYVPGKHRCVHIAEAMAQGIRRSGDIPRLVPVNDPSWERYDIACFYGFDRGLEKVFAKFRAAGKPVVNIDLGYFDRRYRHRREGYHKVTVNSRHPTAYFQNIAHPSNRADRLSVRIQPWRNGGEFILLVGMTPRAAKAAGLAPNKWEERAVSILKQHTDREIWFRPKPNLPNPDPIEGTIFCHDGRKIEDVMEGCHAVVAHHSNVALEAILAGIPAFCDEGVATVLARNDLSKIEDPLREGDRQQLLNDVAYTQWHVQEMREGYPWLHLKREGLIP